MKRNAVLAVRREVNHLRRAGLTEAQIAASLTRLRVAAPTGHAWVEAGIGPRWSARSVTRFMERTRSQAETTAAVTARRPALVAGSASTPRRAGYIRCVAPLD